MKEIRITEQEQNQRLDKYLLKYFNQAQKSFIYKMLRKKRIKLNGKRAEGKELLAPGDTLQLYLAEETMDGFMEAKEVPVAIRHFGIVYEDDNILVVNKPQGLLSHPEKSTDTDTLIHQILYYLKETGAYQPAKDTTFTPALCNRLDRNTSGIVIAGKTLAATQAVNAALQAKKLDKFYLAVAEGIVSKGQNIKAYHMKNQDTNRVSLSQQEISGSKEAITEYNPLLFGKDHSLLEVKLHTGKTHQIRANMSLVGHPILGDRKYGKGDGRRIGLSHQYLHGWRIVWQEKEGVLGYLYGKELIAPLPKKLQEVGLILFGDEFLSYCNV